MGRILVLGGYGGFGARLSRRLAAAGHQVLVAGRTRLSAEAFCADLPGSCPIVADRDGDLATLLAAERPDLVIDAAGPFQGSGYDVPRACIASRIPYLDLADGRDFVAGIGELDGAARQASVAVITGASSVPALSGAVIRHLAAGMERTTAVEMAISASNRATAGPSVAAAILHYAGQPIRLWRGGRWLRATGWQELRRCTMSLAGGPDLGRRWVALADVPDLAILPDRLPGRPAVTFRAGTELAVQTIGLWLASWLVRWGWLRSLSPFSRWLLPIQAITRGFGSDRSGMRVRLFGFAEGRRVSRSWTLLAEQGDGPEIPTLAAAILAERILAGAVPPGAGDAGSLLDLTAFEPAFRGLAIRHESSGQDEPLALYRRVMGKAFDTLPPTLRAMHEVLADAGAEGRAVVTRGRNPLARLIGVIMGFPAEGEHALHVHFQERDGTEVWTRDFAGTTFRSRLAEKDGRLTESFGPLTFCFDLPSGASGLTMIIRRWTFAGIPMPRWLGPRSEAREWEEDGVFQFDVPIALPLIGPVIHYRGWLKPIGAYSAR